MADSKEASALAQALVPEIGASPTTSATPAGPTDDGDRQQLVEALNQVFALFRLNFHNQFYAAYPDGEQLKQVKRLWLDALSDFPAEVILRGAKHALESSDYLPTLKRMIDSCQQALVDQGLPSPRQAFIEACEKPSPKLAQSWSHPVVYFAGRDCDWFFLSNNSEQIARPVFENHYANYLKRLRRGERFALPQHEELPAAQATEMTLEDRKAALQRLRDELVL